MAEAGKNDPIGDLERALAQRGVACVRERFRVPAFPQVSPCAGYLLGAAGAFLLAGGYPAASFLIGISGALLLVLSACGFAPLDWLGPKEKRSVLVVPGTPSEENRKALFLAIPLRCRFTSSENFPREAALRRIPGAFGFLLALVLPLLAGAATLRLIPPLPWAGALAGATLGLLAAGEWVRGKPSVSARNLAAGWVERSIPPRESGVRPYILVYPGEVEEVKFFLAKYRRHVFRGRGVFLEFPETAGGPAAVTVAEGPYLPYRVDRGLLSAVLHAATACGIPSIRTLTLRKSSPALAAMARGFHAITLFRLEQTSVGERRIAPEAFVSWIREIGRGPL